MAYSRTLSESCEPPTCCRQARDPRGQRSSAQLTRWMPPPLFREPSALSRNDTRSPGSTECTRMGDCQIRLIMKFPKA
jgi:hypothetical protein